MKIKRKQNVVEPLKGKAPGYTFLFDGEAYMLIERSANCNVNPTMAYAVPAVNLTTGKCACFGEYYKATSITLEAREI